MGQCCSSPSAKYVEGSVHQPKKERVEEPPPTFGVDNYYDVKTLLGTGGTGQVSARDQY